MCQWHRNIQRMIDEIDACIRREDDETSTLSRLAGKLGYSESYVSRKFRELSGMRLREYLCGRRLAFALRELRWKRDSGHCAEIWLFLQRGVCPCV